MTADSEGLHAIANTDKSDRVADIVFVHGLAGGSHSTWRYGKKGKPGYFFWPEELGRELPHCGVWCVGYAAGLTKLGKPGMIIEKRAGNIASQLTMRDLGDRPIVFITHSMGGLVVKSLIVNSQLNADSARQRLVAAIRGVIFCGTPHRGSAFASAAGVLGASQKHVKEMEANAEQLDLLHDHFLAWCRHDPIAIESYAENIGLGRTNWYGRALPLAVVVNRSSANPNIGTMHDVDADHSALVKPTPAVKAIYDIVYRGVLRFVASALQTARRTTPAAGVVHAAAKLVNANVLFDIYGKESEPYYYSRIFDSVLESAAQFQSVWVCGASGSGKTSAIRRLIALHQLSPVEVCLANCAEDLNPGALADEIAATLAAQSNEGMPRSPEQYKWLVNELANRSKRAPIVLYLDEVPISAARPDAIANLTTFVGNLLITVKANAGDPNLRFVISSISMPDFERAVHPGQLKERMKLLIVPSWQSEELSGLLQLLEPHLPDLQITDAFRNELLLAAAGSPRFLKTFLRIFVGNLQRDSVSALSETKHRLHNFP